MEIILLAMNISLFIPIILAILGVNLMLILVFRETLKTDYNFLGKEIYSADFLLSTSVYWDYHAHDRAIL